VGESDADVAPRRTRLAGERTQLAWWRTGLAAFAVGIGIGRGIPAIDTTATEWPLVGLGLGFVVYGILLIAFGNRRGAYIDRAVLTGDYAAPDPLATRVLGGFGLLLGLGTAVVVVLPA
jgi:putative membrane protein